MTTETKIATPLSRKAMLVSVSISQWSARKLDKRVTDETNRKYNAADNAGRYNKLLIESERLAKITAIVSAARALHYSMTMPWADDGPRILPNKLFVKFSESFRTLKREFEAAADEFAVGYPGFVAERKIALNGLFNESDYPDASEIRNKFHLEMSLLPFPDADDFRAELDADTVADIKREIAETSSHAIGDAMRHTARQIVETVGRMASKLKEYKPGEGKEKAEGVFRNSLVENVRELANLLPAFNLTEDPKLAAITDRIAKELCAENASDLRKNDTARESVAKSADEIVAAVSQFLA
jgi:hypothetical protein